MKRECLRNIIECLLTATGSINNFGVGLVLRSEHAALKKGDHVYGMLPFQEYSVVADPADIDSACFRVLDNKEGLPWSVYVGVCGMPGEQSRRVPTCYRPSLLCTGATAHHAWNEYSRAKRGETAFVTAAAGPVGAYVALFRLSFVSC